jgi:hypothetical protein
MPLRNRQGELHKDAHMRRGMATRRQGTGGPGDGLVDAMTSLEEKKQEALRAKQTLEDRVKVVAGNTQKAKESRLRDIKEAIDHVRKVAGEVNELIEAAKTAKNDVNAAALNLATQADAITDPAANDDKAAKEAAAAELYEKAKNANEILTEVSSAVADVIQKALDVESGEAGNVALALGEIGGNKAKTDLYEAVSKLARVKDNMPSTPTGVKQKETDVNAAVARVNTAVAAMTEVIENYNDLITLAKQINLGVVDIEQLIEAAKLKIGDANRAVQGAEQATIVTYHQQMAENHRLDAILDSAYAKELFETAADLGVTLDNELEAMAAYAINSAPDKLKDLIAINDALSKSGVATLNLVKTEATKLVQEGIDYSKNPEELKSLIKLVNDLELEVDTSIESSVFDKVKGKTIAELDAYAEEQSKKWVMNADSSKVQKWVNVAKLLSTDALERLTNDIQEKIDSAASQRMRNAMIKGAQAAGLDVTKPQSIDLHEDQKKTDFEILRGNLLKSIELYDAVAVNGNMTTVRQLQADANKGWFSAVTSLWAPDYLGLIKEAGEKLQKLLDVAVNKTIAVYAHYVVQSSDDLKGLAIEASQLQTKQPQVRSNNDLNGLKAKAGKNEAGSKAAGEAVKSFEASANNLEKSAENVLTRADGLKKSSSKNAIEVIGRIIEVVTAVKEAAKLRNADSIPSSITTLTEFIYPTIIKTLDKVGIAKEVNETAYNATSVRDSGNITLNTEEAIKNLINAAKEVAKTSGSVDEALKNADGGMAEYLDAIRLLGGDTNIVTADINDAVKAAAEAERVKAEEARAKAAEAERVKAEEARAKAAEAERVKAEEARAKAEEARAKAAEAERVKAEEARAKAAEAEAERVKAEEARAKPAEAAAANDAPKKRPVKRGNPKSKPKEVDGAAANNAAKAPTTSAGATKESLQATGSSKASAAPNASDPKTSDVTASTPDKAAAKEAEAAKQVDASSSQTKSDCPILKKEDFDFVADKVSWACRYTQLPEKIQKLQESHVNMEPKDRKKAVETFKKGLKDQKYPCLQDYMKGFCHMPRSGAELEKKEIVTKGLSGLMTKLSEGISGEISKIEKFIPISCLKEVIQNQYCITNPPSDEQSQILCGETASKNLDGVVTWGN